MGASPVDCDSDLRSIVKPSSRHPEARLQSSLLHGPIQPLPILSFVRSQGGEKFFSFILNVTSIVAFREANLPLNPNPRHIMSLITGVPTDPSPVAC